MQGQRGRRRAAADGGSWVSRVKAARSEAHPPEVEHVRTLTQITIVDKTSVATGSRRAQNDHEDHAKDCVEAAKHVCA